MEPETILITGSMLFLGSVCIWSFLHGLDKFRGWLRIRRRVREMQIAIRKL